MIDNLGVNNIDWIESIGDVFVTVKANIRVIYIYVYIYTHTAEVSVKLR